MPLIMILPRASTHLNPALVVQLAQLSTVAHLRLTEDFDWRSPSRGPSAIAAVVVFHFFSFLILLSL